MNIQSIHAQNTSANAYVKKKAPNAYEDFVKSFNSLCLNVA